MHILKILPILFLTNTYLCENINDYFKKTNEEYKKLNSISAEISWNSSVNPNDVNLSKKSAIYQKTLLVWQQNKCKEMATLFKSHLLNDTQRRQTYLLCRGPKYTYHEARLTSHLYEKLQTIYNDAEICITTTKNISIDNTTDVETTIINFNKIMNKVLDNVQLVSEIAVSENEKNKIDLCIKGDKDFEKIMSTSRNEEVLKWVWIAWREIVSGPMRTPYRELIEVENVAARRNGYKDIGDSWRDEQEIPNIGHFCRQLYESIRPLYKILHGIARFFLRRHYGDILEENGPIPAHLLGNLWSQNWEPLIDFILEDTLNLDGRIKKSNWTVLHMAKRAEDFYQSLGLPPMTDTFWRESVFTREQHKNARCHGAAADMFQDGDFRLLYCSGTTKEDFYVLHHELGHIQYFMAYEDQQAIFRQANTALHETIGDTIMIGAMTPQHLHRLGLINDQELYSADYITVRDNDNIIDAKNDNYFDRIKETIIDDKYNDANIKDANNDKYYDAIEGTIINDKYNDDIRINDKEFKLKLSIDEVLLLKQAFNKIPQIPFGLLLEEYRWNYFEGSLKNVNGEFWEMVLELQGIVPPVDRNEEYFDAGSKYHVPDNTPYARYFLSAFLQHQVYETLCKAAVFGRRKVDEPLPSTIEMHRCDIYGSKTVGRILQDIMKPGHSKHWREVLKTATGITDISAGALKRYYRPLYKTLDKLIKKYNIPIGW